MEGKPCNYIPDFSTSQRPRRGGGEGEESGADKYEDDEFEESRITPPPPLPHFFARIERN